MTAAVSQPTNLTRNGAEPLPTTAIAKPTLLQKVAGKYSLEPNRVLSTIKATIFNDKGNEAEMVAFLIVCDEYDLNPFTKEIYGFPNKKGGITPVVSVDGWLKLINRQPNMDGMEFQDTLSESGNLESVTCRIYRKDRAHPTEVTEYMVECKRDTDPWRQWPRRMLRHKATIQSARIAFGFSGIYDEDEAERISGSVDALPPMPKRITTSTLTEKLTAPTAHDIAPPQSDEYHQPSAPDETSQEPPDAGGELPVSNAEVLRGIKHGFERGTTEAEVNQVYDAAKGPESPYTFDVDESTDIDVWYKLNLTRVKAQAKKGKSE